jgi:hypothetical protein
MPGVADMSRPAAAAMTDTVTLSHCDDHLLCNVISDRTVRTALTMGGPPRTIGDWALRVVD